MPIADLIRWIPSMLIATAAVLVSLVIGVMRLRRLGVRDFRTGLDAVRTGPPSGPVRNVLTELAMVVGTAPWLVLILTPQPLHAARLYLVPFRDLADQFRVGLGFACIQIVGNLLVFAAFGFFAPTRWRIGLVAVASIAAATSAGLEAIQYVQHMGRVTSVDDVFVNTLGAVLFALASRPFWARRGRPGCNRDRPGVNDRSGRRLDAGLG